MINIKSISHTTVNDLKPNATQTYHSKKIAMQSEAGSLFALSTFRFRTVFPGFFRPSLSLSLMQKYPHPTPTVLSLYSPLPPYTPLIIIIIIIISHTNRLLLNARDTFYPLPLSHRDTTHRSRFVLVRNCSHTPRRW